MIFPESSLANLGSLGYTEDEARFLYLVATHSGYFSMRQFLQFTGTKSGDKIMAFYHKLLAKGHATARSFLRNGLVYHLFSRIVYRAIGRENLRNRRAHSLEHIRTRLVVLDFVLAHLQYEYLETEDDKLNTFVSSWTSRKNSCPGSVTPEPFTTQRPSATSWTSSPCSSVPVPSLPLWLPSRSSIPDLASWTVSKLICWPTEVCSKRFPRYASSMFR